MTLLISGFEDTLACLNSEHLAMLEVAAAVYIGLPKDALLQLAARAGGLGLNLTGADYVIHVDPWWNPAVEDQASDRAYRMGQTRPVTIYRLVTKNTVEEKILALHQHKRELAEGLLAGTDSGVRICAEDLLRPMREDQGRKTFDQEIFCSARRQRPRPDARRRGKDN